MLPTGVGGLGVESTKNDIIMRALGDSRVHMIGLYGLPGVGKTTLATLVARKARVKKLFDGVFFVEVKEYGIEHIQRQIAIKVGLNSCMQIENEARADQLYHRLKKERRLLIVLDGLLERLDMKEVGIPSTDGGHTYHKIILTSTKKDLLFTQIECKRECKRNIEVGLLSKEEAWALLKRTAEISDNDDNDLVSKAKMVSEKCAQLLPVKKIVEVAQALRNEKSPNVWEDVLRKLMGRLPKLPRRPPIYMF